MENNVHPDDPAYAVNFALRHKLTPRIKWKDEHTSQRAAEAILEHLRLCGWEFTKRPPLKHHSTP